MSNLFDEVIKAQQTFEEEFTGVDPIDSYRKDLVKLLDLPTHSSMEDIYNYLQQLIKEVKTLTETINSHSTK